MRQDTALTRSVERKRAGREHRLVPHPTTMLLWPLLSLSVLSMLISAQESEGELPTLSLELGHFAHTLVCPRGLLPFGTYCERQTGHSPHFHLLCKRPGMFGGTSWAESGHFVRAECPELHYCAPHMPSGLPSARAPGRANPYLQGHRRGRGIHCIHYSAPYWEHVDNTRGVRGVVRTRARLGIIDLPYRPARPAVAYDHIDPDVRLDWGRDLTLSSPSRPSTSDALAATANKQDRPPE